MSDAKPIALEGIPVFTGNLATLDTKVTELTSAAETIATTTGDVHSSFGGLQAFYQAPEAEQLFATTKPVVDTGQKMKSDLTTISRALSTYSDEVYPLVEKLKEIKRDAGAFLVKINADDKWREDGDLIDENNHRRDEIADTLAAFQDAEITCHNKIVALVCGVPLKKSDGSDSAHQYGFDAETYKHAEGLPWGDPLVESIPGWQVWEHAWEFTKGFFVDGVWGTIKGLGTLVGFDGFDAAGQAWKGLAQLATGVAISLSPVAAVQFWTADEKDMPSWLRDSRNAVKETGKALVAWDQWGDNPSRAAGAVTFNVVTTVFTGGTGAAASGAGKTALAAKALSAAGKVGRIVDPMTYVFKGAGVGLSKIGDVMAGLKGLGKIEIPPLPDNVFTLPDGWTRLPDGTLDVPAGATLPEGATRLPDGAVKLPEGTIALPPNTLKSPFDEGSAYADIDGNLYDEHGNLVQKGANARKELSETADTNTPDHTHLETPARQPVLVGAGARVGEVADDGIHMGGSSNNDLGAVSRAEDSVPDGPIGKAENHLPSGRANHMSDDSTPTEVVSNDGVPGGAGHHATPSTGGFNDGPETPGGVSDVDGPSSIDEGSTGGGPENNPGKPEQQPAIMLEGNRTGQQPSGPMTPEQEAALTAALKDAKVPPVDQGRMVTQLKKSEYGAAVAEYISSGRFADLPMFKDREGLLFQVKQNGMIPAVHQAMEHAAELQDKGIKGIEFELKLPGDRLDLDVLVRIDGRIEYGAQLKDVDSVAGISSAVKKIAAKQLAGSGVGVKAGILDIKGFKSELTEREIRSVQRAADRTNASFELKFDDGSVTIYPTNSVE
ncbi:MULTISPECIES: hypothetical protein [Streptomyces]|uniref:Uncharacterized protein n=1 Tax=Streptomyces flavovirens TaxID=52258 RepID=A0ABV8N2G1_9ACTN